MKVPKICVYISVWLFNVLFSLIWYKNLLGHVQNEMTIEGIVKIFPSAKEGHLSEFMSSTGTCHEGICKIFIFLQYLAIILI